MRVCPICGKEPGPRGENKAFPFCSPTCKLVDLGKWLDGTYRIPTTLPPDEDATGDGDVTTRGDK